jgi:chromate transporter
VTSRTEPSRGSSSPLEVFLVALGLGVRSFGGPVAHLAYFRREYVERRRWLDEETYADIVALCQFLPGPASSETGMAIGLLRAGPLGAVAAWLGFTLPSAVLMTAFALFFDRLPFEAGFVFPILELVALAVVAFAVWRMAHVLAWDLPRGAVALAAAVLVILSSSPLMQIGVIVAGGIVGRLFLPAPAVSARTHAGVPIGRGTALVSFAVYLMVLALAIVAVAADRNDASLFASFYRSGALVFGGGHVVLPLLHTAVVDPEWVSDTRFFGGYGLAQVMPGPLFTFAGYLGGVIDGVRGALIALVAIFLPGFLLVFAALPSWGALRTRPWAQSTLRGVNAAVVGLLLAALVTIARAIASTLI